MLWTSSRRFDGRGRLAEVGPSCAVSKMVRSAHVREFFQVVVVVFVTKLPD